jgi:nicotinate-nucleotide pyrophosphorylase (carboxylating)
MKIEDIKKAVKLKNANIKKYGIKIILEASGGISSDNIKKIAKAGVDRISIGRLTHSAPSIDFSLEICK